MGEFIMLIKSLPLYCQINQVVETDLSIAFVLYRSVTSSLLFKGQRNEAKTTNPLHCQINNKMTVFSFTNVVIDLSLLDINYSFLSFFLFSSCFIHVTVALEPMLGTLGRDNRETGCL